MTDQPWGGRPDEEPEPPHPGWAPVQPPTGPPPAGAPPVPPTAPYPLPGPPAQGDPQQSYPPTGYPPPAYPGQPQQSFGGYAYAPAPAPKPGVIPLRPLGIGEILDGAIQCVRANPKIMLGLCAVVVTLTQLLSFALSLSFARDLNAIDPTTAAPEDVLGAAGGLLGVALITWLLGAYAQLVLSGGLAIIVSRAVLGEHVTLGGLWALLRPRLLRLLLVSLIVLAASGAALAFCAIPGVALYTMWWLAAPALVLEKCGVTAALGRSWALVKGAFWRVFLILLLTTVLTYVIAQIVSVPFAVLGGLSSFSMSSDDFGTVSTLSLFASTLGAIVGGILTYPFTAAVTVLAYVDRRMRLEGLDLELTRAAGAQPPTPR